MSKDQQIIDFMFDPFLIEYNYSNPENDNEDEDHSPQPETLSADQIESKRLEMEAVELINIGDNKNNDGIDYNRCYQLFAKALEKWPGNISVYNNRAQVYRLQNRIDDALADLNHVIELIETIETKDNPGKLDQNSIQHVARQAYCQRSMIFMLRNQRELGLDDMKRSTQLGNRFAQSYMAKMNPYAALCNQMLQDMFKQYQ